MSIIDVVHFINRIAHLITRVQAVQELTDGMLMATMDTLQILSYLSEEILPSVFTSNNFRFVTRGLLIGRPIRLA